MQRKGFTLIELLVVISIIGLLSSVVLASLSTTRDKAKIAAGQQFEGSVFRAAGDMLLADFPLNECTGSTAGNLYNGNNGALTNGPTWSTDRPNPSGCSTSFDGVNDYIVTTNNLGISGNPDLTMCAWIKWSGAWVNEYPSFMGNNTTGITNQGLSFTVYGGRPAMDFWALRYRATNAISADQWHMLCGVKTPGLVSATTKLYVDGIQVAGAVEGTDAAPNIIDAPIVIGRLDGTRYFRGLIDNVRFYNKSLVASEIGALYALGKPGHIDDLARK